VIHDESNQIKTATVDTVLAIADETGHSPGQIAIAWVLAKGTLPIIGPRTAEQLADNLASVDVQLTSEQLSRLDAASAITLGFPHDIVAASAASLGGGKHELIDTSIRALR